MPRFRNSFLSWTAIILVLFVLVVSIIFNILIGLNKAKIVDAANTLISDQLDIGYMVYVFPNIVIVKNAVLTPKDDLDPARVVRFPIVTAEFSILEFVLRQSVAVQKIKLYGPYIHHGYFSDFLKRNGKHLMDFLLRLPRIDFRFSIKEVLWDFTAGAGSPDYVQLNFVFWMKKDTIRVQGAARKDKYVHAPKHKTRQPREDPAGVSRGWPPWASLAKGGQRQAAGLPLEFDFQGVPVNHALHIGLIGVKTSFLRAFRPDQRPRNGAGRDNRLRTETGFRKKGRFKRLAEAEIKQ